MPVFTDNQGRDWFVRIDVAAMYRVRTYAGVNLLDAAAAGEVLGRVAGDPATVADLLYAACAPQADARNVTRDGFATAVSGDAIDRGVVAVVEAIGDFYPASDGSDDKDSAPQTPAQVEDLLWEYAGMSGVNPYPLTFRELVTLGRARQKVEWVHTANVMALIANANRDAKQRSKPYTPDDFNPFATKRKPLVIGEDIQWEALAQPFGVALTPPKEQ